MPYIVSVDDNFHYQDPDERYTLGTFETEAQAVSAARALVDQFLSEQLESAPSQTPSGQPAARAMSAEKLYAYYTSFGPDPFISGHPFSAWSYAKERCAALCGG